MPLIPLTQGKFTIVDDEDFEELNQYKWYFQNSERGYGYAARTGHEKDGKNQIRMHRHIMDVVLSDKVVDHINHDTLDNRRENLRVCTNAENMLNRKGYKNNKLGVIGIRFKKGRFEARIQVNKKPIFLGTYSTLQGAWLARRWGERLYHKEFAYLGGSK